MHAMNHAITALVLRKRFGDVPLLWLLLSVQLMEFLWVGLNWMGFEFITVDSKVQTLANIHLSHMPYSHSVGSALLIAGCVGLLFRRAGLALAVGVLSHLVLDLATHVQDIPLWWGATDTRLGSGVYGMPILALVVETGYGLAVWCYVGGRIGLLLAIALFQLSMLSLHFAWISGFEAVLAGQPQLLTSVVAVQIVLTLSLVWWLGRSPRTTGDERQLRSNTGRHDE